MDGFKRAVKPSACRVSECLGLMREHANSGEWRNDLHRAMVQVSAFMSAVEAAALTDDEFAFVNGFVDQIADAAEDEAKGGRA